MRAVVIIVVILLVLVLLGWLKFSTNDGNPAIQLDTQEIQDDTNRAVEGVKGAAEKVDEQIDIEVRRKPEADESATE
ncbi:hypothetical protein [Roseimaritima sediminicola]|uniref:hypothetical protein n=1 Tax=Roseimaritima sediminicola TaxID=2662066 RepID=UPI00129839D7|nr:hypothetical protein [Roseimaritima sediminicola]